MLIILFGLSGAGKNYVGQILNKYFNYFYWDADNDLPSEMQKSIELQQCFTQTMRDDFTKILIQKITQLSSSHRNIVISQALYKEKNRLEITTHFPLAQLIHVQADLELIDQRLKQRSAQDFNYGRMIADNFEKPISKHTILTNNEGELSIINQLKLILKASGS